MAGVPMGDAYRRIHRLFVEGTWRASPTASCSNGSSTSGDEAAFAALVERHGPMVLGTCRALLRDAGCCGGRVPGDVPGAGLQGPVDPGPGRSRQLALSGRPSHRHSGRRLRRHAEAEARTARRSAPMRRTAIASSRTMSGARSCTRRSPGCRTSTGCPCCCATWRERPTPRPPPSSTAARRPSGDDCPPPASCSDPG